MDPSRVLRSVDIFDYVVLCADRSEEAAAIVAESFADEPTVPFCLWGRNGHPLC